MDVRAGWLFETSGVRLLKPVVFCSFFFFNDAAPPEFSPLPLPAALPISRGADPAWAVRARLDAARRRALPHHDADRARDRVLRRDRAEVRDRETESDRAPAAAVEPLDRKSTRLNSSHGYISYAVFCLKKK